MYCPFCGLPYTDRSATFCPHCGRGLLSERPAVPADAATLPANAPAYPPVEGAQAPTQDMYNPLYPPVYPPVYPPAFGTPLASGARSRAPSLRMLLGLTVIGALLIVAGGAYFARSYFAPQGISRGAPPIVTSSATPSPVATQAPVVAAAPTDTVAVSTAVDADCRSLSGFDSTPPASSVASDNGYAPPNTPTVPFPANAPGFLSKTFTDPSPTNPQVAYHFILLSACASATDMATVQGFYASEMINAGWSQTGNFPYAGDSARLCGDPYCWNWGPAGGATTRFAALEAVQQAGTAVTFQLRLGTEQTQ
ncbi:MAG TPA: zinc ribbon domain-containing protein [Ktedonobacterales bacterium]|nr:zinc ribbon domain-containing protein [Ktedonobacterales bacterium]